MTILLRFTGRLASAARAIVRLSPKVIPLALVSVIGLSAGRPADADRDGDSDETTRSIVYRHYI
ncbi:hypothetical protein ASF53_07475 [Methylobacterium sp. Leaf123]|uniref:hypothetical protein n=1 Tax=Methylobacterium sp. Leaf123 TaxID=1736264 RepID=UPI00070190E3|nr:hypothetical protein [Methylobacterium sp. Leaf123]KQQ18191.1 hypothetical protein ASF53_07475 [Methylobacterium sp. Leaf123]